MAVHFEMVPCMCAMNVVNAVSVVCSPFCFISSQCDREACSPFISVSLEKLGAGKFSTIVMCRIKYLQHQSS